MKRSLFAWSLQMDVQARRPAIRWVIAFCGLLLGLGVTPQALAQSAGKEWLTQAGTPQGTRFSALADINTGNVAQLKEEFAFSTGVKASHQGGPLVVGSTIYVVSPFPNKLFALDLAHGGKLLWAFAPSVDGYAHGVACCDTVNRGAAYADGKIIYNVLDDTTVAVDALTGKQVWRTRLGDPRTGQTLTMAPLVVDNHVLVGNAGGELGIRGWILALDLKTGREVWRAYSTGPDSDVRIGAQFHPYYPKDQGTDLGASTWPATLWKQGGGTVWAWLTYDPELKLLYHGTANPGVWNPDMRPGDNKWGSTIFARNPATGDAVWAYQVTPHDGWDYDAVNESIVARLKIDGVTRKVVVHFNKNGFAYTIDAATGQVLVAEKFSHVTWADHIDLNTGLPAVAPAMMPHQGVVTSGICPSALGAKDWEPAAYSPDTHLFYIPAINFCEDLQPLKALFIAGTPFQGADITLAPGPGGNMGEMIAWDAATGRRAWSVSEPLAVYAGVLATAGDLVFYGTLDRKFKAVDARTGKLLFEKALECGVVSNPISFAGPDGKQRIAVYTGVGWLAGGLAGGTCSAKVGGTGSAGGVVHVFKLP